MPPLAQSTSDPLGVVPSTDVATMMMEEDEGGVAEREGSVVLSVPQVFGGSAEDRTGM